MTPTLNQFKMNISNKIDRFLNNNLSESEKIEFENELIKNPELSNSYKTYSRANSLFEKSLVSPVFDDAGDPILKELDANQKLEIEADFIKYHILYEEGLEQSNLPGNMGHTDDELKFLETLNSPGDEIKPNSKSGVIKAFIGIAATLALTIVTGKYILEIPFLQPSKISPQKAFLTYYNPSGDPELKALSFNNIKLNNSTNESIRSSGKEYSFHSENIAMSKEEYELSLLYKGIMNIERKNTQEAKICFSQLLENKSDTLNHICLYYYALALLSEGNSKDAKPFLKELSQSKSSYSKKSSKLLKSLIDN